MAAGNLGCRALRLRSRRITSPADLATREVAGEDEARAWVKAVDRIDAPAGQRPTPVNVLLISAAQANEMAAYLPLVVVDCGRCGRVKYCVHTYQKARDLRREMFEAVLRWGRRTGNMLPDCA